MMIKCLVSNSLPNSVRPLRDITHRWHHRDRKIFKWTNSKLINSCRPISGIWITSNRIFAHRLQNQSIDCVNYRTEHIYRIYIRGSVPFHHWMSSHVVQHSWFEVCLRIFSEMLKSQWPTHEYLMNFDRCHWTTMLYGSNNRKHSEHLMYSWILCCHIRIGDAHRCADLSMDLAKRISAKLNLLIVWRDLQAKTKNYDWCATKHTCTFAQTAGVYCG